MIKKIYVLVFLPSILQNQFYSFSRSRFDSISEPVGFDRVLVVYVIYVKRSHTTAALRSLPSRKMRLPPCTRRVTCTLAFIVLSVFSGINGLWAAPQATKGRPGESVNEIASWFTTNGGYINDKVSLVAETVQGQPSPIFGMRSNQDITKGETLFTLPGELVLGTGRDDSREHCHTAENLARQVELGEESKFWPYVKAIFADSYDGQLPADWSDDGKALLNFLAPPDIFPGLEFGDISYEADCGSLPSSPLLQKAYLTVHRRAWEERGLLPVIDMINHRNGHWRNTDIRQTLRNNDDDVDLYATRDIKADEQLYLSYGEGMDQENLAGWYATPHILNDFGFVEQYPRRWSFYGPEYNGDDVLLFELDETESRGDHKSVTLTWLSEPPEYGLETFEYSVLQDHSKRLGDIRVELFKGVEKLKSSYERETITEFYQAFHTALDYALISLADLESKWEKKITDDFDDLDPGKERADMATQNSDKNGLEELVERSYAVTYAVDSSNGWCYDGDVEESFELQYAVSSQYQELDFLYSVERDDSCLYINGHMNVCDSVRPHYHEVLVHYAASFIDKVKRVIFIGGGDNVSYALIFVFVFHLRLQLTFTTVNYYYSTKRALLHHISQMILHEVLKYPSLELVVGLELDQAVVRSCFHQFGTQPHWDNDKVEWWFGDAASSLEMLPQDYYGSFDLVLVDMQTDVMEFLGIIDRISLLVKADGIIMTNEDYGFGTNTPFVKHAVDLYSDNVPMFCFQGLTMGSKTLDFFTAPRKDHNVPTLYYKHDRHRFEDWFNYRKSSDEELSKGCCGEDLGAPGVSISSNDSFGVLMILEVEDVVLQSNALELVLSALTNAGLSVQNIVYHVGKITKEEADDNVDDNYDDDENDSDDGYDTVEVSMKEGYVTAKAVPEQKYCAFDIMLWCSTEKLDAAKTEIMRTLRSHASSLQTQMEPSSSSYRILTSGMRGLTCSGNVMSETMVRPRCTPCDNGAPRNAPPVTLADLNNHLPQQKVGSADDEASSGIYAALEARIFSVPLSLIPKNASTVVVVCGEEEVPCIALDAMRLLKVESKEEPLAADVVPLWSCSQSEKESACEVSIERTLTELRESGRTIDGLIFDTLAPKIMGRGLYKALSRAGSWKDLLADKYVVIAPSADAVNSSWLRALLDKFRENFAVRDRTMAKHDPSFHAEILFDGTARKMGLGIFSAGDSTPDFYQSLHGISKKIEEVSGLTPNVQYVKISGIYRRRFDADQVFAAHDYDRTSSDEQRDEQVEIGRQTIFRFEVTKEQEKEPLVYELWESALRQGFFPATGISQPPKIWGNDSLGNGSLIFASWNEGTATLVWDGESSVHVNLFTVYDDEDYEILVHEHFMDCFSKLFSSLVVKSRETYPRGSGRIVNFLSTSTEEDAEEPEEPATDYRTVVDIETPPMQPGEFSFIRWDDGSLYSENAAMVGLPKTTIPALLQWADVLGLREMIYNLHYNISYKHKQDLFYLSELPDKTMLEWSVRTPAEHYNSDIMWFGVANELTHEYFLRAMAHADFDSILETIGSEYI